MTGRLAVAHYLAGLSLAAATVLALDTRTVPMRVTAHGRPPVVATPTHADPRPVRGVGADLPPGAPFPAHGTGRWRVVPGTAKPTGPGPAFAYSVEVEEGVTLPEGDQPFAAQVHHTLVHPRGWKRRGFEFRRVDAAPTLRVRLAAQDTARELCGFDLPYDTSCRIGDTVYLSAPRWIRGAHTYDSLTAYRAYVVNHEVGHFLGYGHEPCPEDGARAPVMMQQTLSTSNDELAALSGEAPADGKTCTPDPWPR
ncbi:DUF3152 domain-containing protein [Saccharothrix sp. NPDC042600]|uniref:DUF3152 domain-containing protein n=1 Tax=Saccharothrix TaxID=2071 RepID=UPI0033E568A6|nr:DUF3152 domain-containing protein [Saccharothrix mutabilis subsp. capreolus]